MYNLDDSHIEDVERDIAPPMKAAITLPILDEDGKDTGVVMYLAVSPWGLLKPSEKELRQIARRMKEIVGHRPAGYGSCGPAVG